MALGDDAADRESEAEALELLTRNRMRELGKLLVVERQAVVLDLEHPARIVFDAEIGLEAQPDLGVLDTARLQRVERVLQGIDDEELEFEWIPLDGSRIDKVGRDPDGRACGARTEGGVRRLHDFAYTIDCCELGEVVWETFNAGNAKLTVKGVTAHPMSSKGVLVNPILVVHDFINMLDRAETPECTENREGFVVLKTMQANPSQAVLTMKVRDHNKALYERKKEKLVRAAEYLRFRHPKASIEIELSDSYANIADAVRDDNRVGIDYLYDALSTAGVEPKTTAMRGGTDGSYLSVKGILTPNYFTGAHNFHSNCEFLPMKSWEKSLEVTLAIIDLTAKNARG